MVLESQGVHFDLLLGRNTYDLWVGYWPQAGSFPMVDRLNAPTNDVATHRPDSLNWGPVFTLGDEVIAGIRDLKAQDGLVVSNNVKDFAKYPGVLFETWLTSPTDMPNTGV
jgi:dihydrofolate reductase